MLTNLIIRDIVLIDFLDIRFNSGLSVLTGETGAGKSILLDSLGFAIGARADTRLIRHNCDRASVSAVFDIHLEHDVMRLLEEHDIYIDKGDKVILRRTLNVDKRSQSFINDQPVSASFLKIIGEHLVDLHGQFQNQRLLKTQTHRLLLDAFSGEQECMRGTAEAFKLWQDAKQQCKQAEIDSERALKEADFIRHAVDEMTSLKPEKGEEVLLAAKRATMMHGEKILAALSEVAVGISSDSGVESKLRKAVHTLQKVSGKAEGQLDTAIEALDRTLETLAEALNEVNRFSMSIDLSPSHLEVVEERLFALRALARKYNVQVDELEALQHNFRRQLDLISDATAGLVEIRKYEEKARKDYIKAAKRLSCIRHRAAERLNKKVKTELAGLYLENANFVADVQDLKEDNWCAEGVDQVSFLISTNPGIPPSPLDKIASGGEIARFMLAVKVVLVLADQVSTVVFDEVDAGVGGAVAAAVGERLRRLGDKGQVLVVTHSPQVAAVGDHHWKVSKTSAESDKGVVNVSTIVQALDSCKREEEIARMLAGKKVTDEARAAAEKLLDGAGP